MAAKRLRILDPVARPPAAGGEAAPRITTVAGAVVGLLSNGWRSFDAMTQSYAELAVEKYEAREAVIRPNPSASSGTPQDTMEELARRCDAVVVGIGH